MDFLFLSVQLQIILQSNNWFFILSDMKTIFKIMSSQYSVKLRVIWYNFVTIFTLSKLHFYWIKNIFLNRKNIIKPLFQNYPPPPEICNEMLGRGGKLFHQNKEILQHAGKDYSGLCNGLRLKKYPPPCLSSPFFREVRLCFQKYNAIL